MMRLRKAALFLHLARGIVTCAVLFPFLGAPARRWHVRRWSRRLLRICGVELELAGAVPDAATQRGALAVCNHISWLDIYVVNSWHPVRFVAKSEIANWPVIGWLCKQTGTLFIERGRKRDAHRVLHEITDVMHRGDIVCVFPEGTTSDGTSVLPFHANLFQAPVSGGLPVLPIGLDYRDTATGQRTLAPAYIGELTLMQTLDAILAAPPITVRLSFGGPLHIRDTNRRELAELARERVLGLCGDTPGVVFEQQIMVESAPGAEGEALEDHVEAPLSR